VNRRETRHRLTAALLQADGPLTAAQLAGRTRLAEKDAAAALAEMVRDGQVVAGELLADGSGRQFRWAARWADQTRRAAKASREQLRQIVPSPSRKILPAERLTIDCPAVRTFHRYVIDEYAPPKDKRLLVFFQCSVRRPFSKSPSHGSMRRAVAAATGFDPAAQFEACPVHVVVLASRIGPVPYELEDVYPANVRGGGVKHFRSEYFDAVLPVLATRMAEYLTKHRRCYEHVAAFADGRYAEVLRAAQRIAGAAFEIFPDKDGERIATMGGRPPRTYWGKFWIQLYRRIVSWLPPKARAAAAGRLEELEVVTR
jgi:hypothetical protein